MKSYTTRTRLAAMLLALCFIISLSVSLSSCSSVTGLFTDRGDNGTTAPSQTTDKISQADPSLERKSGVYTFLAVNEGTSAGSLSSLAICAFDVSGGGMKCLQLPVKLYISGSSPTVSALYQTTYNTALSDGNNADRARELAVAALESAVEKSMCVDIDYYIVTGAAGLAEIVDNLGGITLNVPAVIRLPGNAGTLNTGVQTLDGAKAAAFVNYQSYSTLSAMDAYKMVITAIYAKAKASVGNDIVSLFTLELVNATVSDVPSANGENIFFVRKLLSCDSSAVIFSHISTQMCALPAGKVEIMFRARALAQVNDYLSIYTNPVEGDMFDKDAFFNDSANATANTIYTSAGSASAVYTAKMLEDGLVGLTFG